VNSKAEVSAHGLPRWTQGKAFNMHFANPMDRTVEGLVRSRCFKSVSTHTLAWRIAKFSEVLVADIVTWCNDLESTRTDKRTRYDNHVLKRWGLATISSCRKFIGGLLVSCMSTAVATKVPILHSRNEAVRDQMATWYGLEDENAQTS
jgi:hypothetical protein